MLHPRVVWHLHILLPRLELDGEVGVQRDHEMNQRLRHTNLAEHEVEAVPADRVESLDEVYEDDVSV